MTAPGREWGATVLLCAAGAAAVLFTAGRTWSVEMVARPAPLPDDRLTRTGAELAPLLPALGWVGLAGAAALLATRGVARRALGGSLAATGAGLVAATAWAATGGAAAAAGPGAAGWFLLCGAGGVAVAAAGVLATVRGRRWPAMGTRYERATGALARRPESADSETVWHALDRGEDPTA